MRKFVLRRPSPALGVAFVALLVALGGTSLAAFNLPRNSVGTRQLRNGAVTSKKIKNGAVTTAKLKDGAVTASKINTSGLSVPRADNAANAAHAANADELGGLAPGAYQGKSQWALVRDDGAVLRQSGGITVTHSAGTGLYFLNFGSSVDSRGVSVTNWNSPAGAPSAAVCGGPAPLVTCPAGVNDTNHLFVGTTSTAGAFADHSFFVIVEAP
ncbi:MAG TPA: hypothetical protein VKR21_07505 [Solirubrobacteraceae bacterium]|nr:hypothetical protein [Solirubrobacteraceae bacterium]